MRSAEDLGGAPARGVAGERAEAIDDVPVGVLHLVIGLVIAEVERDGEASEQAIQRGVAAAGEAFVAIRRVLAGLAEDGVLDGERRLVAISAPGGAEGEGARA